MSNATVVFDPYAAADVHNFVQTIVVNHNVASTGQTEWYPVAFFLKDEKGEVLGGLLGDIWAAWLHATLLAVAMPQRGHVFGTLENHPVGHQHYFMTKKLECGESLEGSQENSVGTLLDNPRARTLYQ